VPTLDHKTPLETLRGGPYERIVGLAEVLVDPTFT
jgi:hypothetical protein